MSIIRRLRTNTKNRSKNDAKGSALLWERAELFTQLEGTFAQGKEQRLAFLATACTEGKCNNDSVTEGIEAVAVRDGLTAANRKAVAGWPVASVRVLKGLSTPQARSVIAKATKAGTTNTKDIRKFKTAVVGKTERQTKNETDRNIALAEVLAEDIARLSASFDMLAVIAGAELAQAHPGKNVAAAITFALAQVTKATPVVA
jgi:hypothetical protein